MSKSYKKHESEGLHRFFKSLSKKNISSHELNENISKWVEFGGKLEDIIDYIVESGKISRIDGKVLKYLYDEKIDIDLSKVYTIYQYQYYDINEVINIMKWLDNNNYTFSIHSYNPVGFYNIFKKCNLNNIIDIIEIVGKNIICNWRDLQDYIVSNEISTDILNYLFEIDIFNNRDINIFRKYAENYRFLGSLNRIIYFVKMFRKYRYPYLDYRYTDGYNGNTILHDITYCNYKNIKKSNGIVDYLINILPESYPNRINKIGLKYDSPPRREEGCFDEYGNEIKYIYECDECGGAIDNCYCDDY